MRLIPNWKKSWKYLSVQVAALGVLLQSLAPHLPELQALLPGSTYTYIAIAVIVARVIDQKEPE